MSYVIHISVCPNEVEFFVRLPQKRWLGSTLVIGFWTERHLPLRQKEVMRASRVERAFYLLVTY